MAHQDNKNMAQTSGKTSPFLSTLLQVQNILPLPQRHRKEGKEWSSVENGCEEVPQATWEADECLPEHLDHLRFRCKVDWVDAGLQETKVDLIYITVDVWRLVLEISSGD